MVTQRSAARLLMLLLVIALFAVPVLAQAPSDAVLKLSFPYTIPPEGHLNSFTTRSLMTIGVNSSLIQLPMGFYMWAEGRFRPVLAEKFAFVNENTAYEVTLHANAKWSDGSPITSQDLYDTYTIAKILGWSDFAYVDDVEIIDQHTVRFNMHNPSILVERLILTAAVRPSQIFGALAKEARAVIDSGAKSDSEAWMAVRSKITEFRPDRALFSGPYQFSMNDISDSQMLLSWQPNSLYSDKVKWGQVIIWSGEEDVVTPLVLSGDLYYSTNAYSAAVLDQFRAQGITLARGTVGFGSAMYVNHDQAPLNILEVRKAISHAINREEVAAAVVAAKAPKYIVGFPEHLYGPWVTDELIVRLDPYEYDWDKADAYLTQAGFTRNAQGKWADANGNLLSFEITVPAEFAGFTVAAENVLLQLNDYGLTVVVRNVPNEQHIEEVKNGAFQGAFRLWGTSTPHPRHAYFIDIIRDNYIDPDMMAAGRKGINFPMQGEYMGQPYDLLALYNASAAGFDLNTQRQTVAELAYIFNQTLPIIPIVEEIRLNPLNESKIAGIPAPDDPIWQNTQGDNFFIWGVLNGTIIPAQ